MKSAKKTPTKSPKVGEPVLVRMQPDDLKMIDDWRRQQPDLPSRAEAIRRMIRGFWSVWQQPASAGKETMGGEPTCEVCGGEGVYPIIDNKKGNHRYDIKCPECLGISDEEIERRCAEDRAALEEFLAQGKKR